MADNWFSDVMQGAGRGARNLAGGLYNAFVPEREYANPTGMTPELLARMQAGEQVTLPPRPGVVEQIMNMSGAVDAWRAADEVDQGGREGNEALGNALFAMATLPFARGGLRGKGNAIRAYHGSPNDFHAFDINKAGSTTDQGMLGRAIYASTDPKVAESRAHKYELSISPQNPLDVSLTEWGGKEAAIRGALGLPPTATAQEVTAAARAKGHDATILDYSPVGYHHKEIAAYDPSIIEILRKYGLLPVAGAAAGAAALPQQDERAM